MTKDEFYRARLKPTVCPPGKARGSKLQRPASNIKDATRRRQNNRGQLAKSMEGGPNYGGETVARWPVTESGKKDK